MERFSSLLIFHFTEHRLHHNGQTDALFPSLWTSILLRIEHALPLHGRTSPPLISNHLPLHQCSSFLRSSPWQIILFPSLPRIEDALPLHGRSSPPLISNHLPLHQCSSSLRYSPWQIFPFPSRKILFPFDIPLHRTLSSPPWTDAPPIVDIQTTPHWRCSSTSWTIIPSINQQSSWPWIFPLIEILLHFMDDHLLPSPSDRKSSWPSSNTYLFLGYSSSWKILIHFMNHPPYHFPLHGWFHFPLEGWSPSC